MGEFISGIVAGISILSAVLLRSRICPWENDWIDIGGEG